VSEDIRNLGVSRFGKIPVIAFQRSFFTQDPYQVDGIVGLKTWEALSSNFNSD
jgi:hypothetical protein